MVACHTRFPFVPPAIILEREQRAWSQEMDRKLDSPPDKLRANLWVIGPRAGHCRVGGMDAGLYSDTHHLTIGLRARGWGIPWLEP